MINGTMGVGKSAVCKELNRLLDNSVWLDGDWCWMMNPWIVNDYNIKMVEDNIAYLLRNFLNNPSFEYVIFSWVIHKEEIFSVLLDKLQDIEFQDFRITLLCSEEALKERIMHDVDLNLRSDDMLNSSIERLELYKNMNTEKIDTTNISAMEAARKTLEIIEK